MADIDYNERDPKTGLPLREPGIEEGDWLDYIQPLKGLFKGQVGKVAGIISAKGVRALKNRMPSPKRKSGKTSREAKPAEIDYNKDNIAFRATKTESDATHGFKPSEGIRPRNGVKEWEPRKLKLQDEDI